MKNYLRGQQGVTVLMAIGFMCVLAILISGLLPYVSNLIRGVTFTTEHVQADYAAEAGAKRALVSLARDAYDKSADAAPWGWLGNNTNVLTDNSAGTYKVTIQQRDGGGNYTAYVPTAGTFIPPAYYKITSVGSFQGRTSTIYVILQVNANEVTFTDVQWQKMRS
ncbi:MAG: hypothetical protein LLG02_05490 [Pelosinus sp.]|nr:hypothetical protein [Pelosinus sp.]